MFDIDRFASACRVALAERGSDAIREVVRRAVSEPGEIVAALGEQTGAFADILVRTPTPVDVVFAATIHADDGAVMVVVGQRPLAGTPYDVENGQVGGTHQNVSEGTRLFA